MQSHKEQITGSKEYWCGQLWPFIWLRQQLCRDWAAMASVCCERSPDWQAPLIGIDAATRYVSMLWLLISPGVQRRPQPPPCCHRCSEMGVTVIKFALKHGLHAVHMCVRAICCVCLHAFEIKCVWVCTGLSPARLCCSSGYLCPSPLPTHQSLLTNSSLCSCHSCELTLKVKKNVG